MKRSMLALALLAVAGSSWGQMSSPVATFGAAVKTLVVGNAQFPGGLAPAGELFLAGHVTEGFKANTEGFSGFAVVLTQNTPFASFGTGAAQYFMSFYNGLVPLYEAFDGPAAQLVVYGAPLTKPLSAAIVTLSGFTNAPLPGLD